MVYMDVPLATGNFNGLYGRTPGYRELVYMEVPRGKTDLMHQLLRLTIK